MLFFPLVNVNVGDLDNIIGIIRVLSILGNSWNVNNHGGHCSDRLEDLVAIIKLNVVSNLLEGAVEHSRVMCARVIEDVVLEPGCLADILGGCPPPQGCCNNFDADNGPRDGSAGQGLSAGGGDRVSCLSCLRRSWLFHNNVVQ